MKLHYKSIAIFIPFPSFIQSLYFLFQTRTFEHFQKGCIYPLL
uniref:Uncharacterized protein n=1 Tax=Lepeophtheirus salmonis TaxID=72036 RepID=A0A0K2UFD5_LEPSM